MYHKRRLMGGYRKNGRRERQCVMGLVRSKIVGEIEVLGSAQRSLSEEVSMRY